MNEKDESREEAVHGTIQEILDMAATGQLLDTLNRRFPGGMVLIGRAQPNERYPDGADRVVMYCDPYMALGLLDWGHEYVRTCLLNRAARQGNEPGKKSE